MFSSAHMASIASAIGDPVRVNMLMALRLEGALTAGELAKVGNVAPSTASEHLSKMMAARLIVQQKLGRKRLYTMADDESCALLDGVEAMAKKQSDAHVNVPRLDKSLVHSRLCYHHIAGKLGCGLTDAMFAEGILTHTRAGPALSDRGKTWARRFDIDTEALDDSPRMTVRLCLDWTEERPHLGGALGSALLDALIARDWVRSFRGKPEILVTPRGFSGFRQDFGFDLKSVPLQTTA